MASRAGGGGGPQGSGTFDTLSDILASASTWCASTADSLRFENWAPRSSRAWRLREFKSESDASQYRGRNDDEDGPSGDDVVGMLEETLRQMKEDQSTVLGLECIDDEEGDVCLLTDEEEDEEGGAAPSSSSGNLPDLGFGATIENRYKQTLLSAPPLTGQELADLCYAKYGKFHDMCVKNQCLNKGKTRRWVALNIYIGHLQQKSFPMTTEEYVQKLNSVAAICTGLRQSAYVRQFFAEPPIPRRGLPSRPRADTAVSLRLNRSPTWSDDMAEEFFSS